MNRWRNFLIFMIAIFMGVALWRGQRSEPETQSRPKSLPTPVTPSKVSVSKEILSPQPPVATPTVLAPTPAKVTDSTENPHQPPKGSVPFNLINGWVIAYGDIVLGKPTEEEFPSQGYIQAPKLKLWEGGVIPFSIHTSLPNPERVLRVITYLNEMTPIRFVPYAGQADSLVFFPIEGLCLSYLGRSGGNQPIYLDPRCSEHEILHEVMHALGFIHEHSRLDRDQYVKINWSNIEDGKQDQFDLTPEELNAPLKGRPFDYKSVMLYGAFAFARDRSQPTLQSRREDAVEPSANGLSVEDLERVRRLYMP